TPCRRGSGCRRREAGASPAPRADPGPPATRSTRGCRAAGSLEHVPIPRRVAPCEIAPDPQGALQRSELFASLFGPDRLDACHGSPPSRDEDRFAGLLRLSEDRDALCLELGDDELLHPSRVTWSTDQVNWDAAMKEGRLSGRPSSALRPPPGQATAESIACVSRAFGTAPMICSWTLPSLNTIRFGMPRTPYLLGVCGLSSTFILTTFSLP